MKATLQKVVLLGILVVMVFAVTFASMYVRRTPTNPKPNKGDSDPPAPSLSFARTRYPLWTPQDPPQLRELTVKSEFRSPASFDFWFTNDNDEEVRVGPKRKNCDCSSVKIFLAADGWRKQLAATARKQWSLMRYIVLPAVVSAGADSGTWLDVEDKEGVVVPAHAAGFVRLTWTARRWQKIAHTQNLTAELWTQTPDRVSISLSVGVMFVDPIFVDVNSVSVGALEAGESTTATVRCWSSTRPDFDLEIRSADNPLIVCRKERLTRAEADELQRTSHTLVLSGWRLTVTVRERSEDGKHRLDLGPFTHTLTLVPVNIRTAHPEVVVQGIVRGDLVVAGGSFVRLGQFNTGTGTSRQVKLTSERHELNLKLHSHPPFMKVRLDKEGPGAWQLSVAIEPNKVSGSFPRADNKAYRDSAIYLTIEGEGRRLRIPVTGNGFQ